MSIISLNCYWQQNPNPAEPCDSPNNKKDLRCWFIQEAGSETGSILREQEGENYKLYIFLDNYDTIYDRIFYLVEQFLWPT